RPRGRTARGVRRDLCRHPEGDAPDRGTRRAEDVRDPFPEVQSRRGPVQVLAPGPVHDRPPRVPRPPLRLGPPRRIEGPPRGPAQTDPEGEGAPDDGTQTPSLSLGSRIRAEPASSPRSL